MRAASQRLGLVKQADTNNYYRPWGFNPDGSVRRPAGQAPAMQKTPPPKGYAPELKQLNTAATGITPVEGRLMGAVTLAGNSANRHITDVMRQEEENVAKGPWASIGRGTVVMDANGQQRAVNTADQQAASRAARQYRGNSGTTWHWWNPKTWGKRPGVNAGANSGIQVVSRKLKGVDPASSYGSGGRGTEYDRVADLRESVDSGTAINLQKQHRYWGLGPRKVDARYIYKPEAWGTHLVDTAQELPAYFKDEQKNKDYMKMMKAPEDLWTVNPDGTRTRKITDADLDYDRKMRASHLYNALYGSQSENTVEQERYEQLLQDMSRMRNDPRYYNNQTGTWTSAALDHWRNDNEFNTVFNNINTSSRYDQNAVLNAFLANANNMYRDNAPFIPAKPTGI